MTGPWHIINVNSTHSRYSLHQITRRASLWCSPVLQTFTTNRWYYPNDIFICIFLQISRYIYSIRYIYWNRLQLVHHRQHAIMYVYIYIYQCLQRLHNWWFNKDMFDVKIKKKESWIYYIKFVQGMYAVLYSNRLQLAHHWLQAIMRINVQRDLWRHVAPLDQKEKLWENICVRKRLTFLICFFLRYDMIDVFVNCAFSSSRMIQFHRSSDWVVTSMRHRSGAPCSVYGKHVTSGVLGWHHDKHMTQNFQISYIGHM